jgi:hypothetical protein
VASWANGPQFFAHVGAAMGGMTPEMMGEDFIKDRQARFGMDLAALGRAAPHLAGQALVASQWLSDTLADGRAFIGADEPGAGDLALYSNIWFVKGVNFVFAVLFLKQELSGLVENGRKDFCKIFSDFLFRHYSIPDDHDGDSEKDEKLPFKKHHDCFLAHIQIVLHQNTSIKLKLIEEELSEPLLYFEENLPQGSLSNIWQPPKFS